MHTLTKRTIQLACCLKTQLLRFLIIQMQAYVAFGAVFIVQGTKTHSQGLSYVSQPSNVEAYIHVTLNT